MKRLLLVSHRAIDQAGGPAARWRSFARHLPEHGWEVGVVAAGGGDEYAAPRSAQARARVMETAGRLADPLFQALPGPRPGGHRPPLTLPRIPRGAREIRKRLRGERYDAALATAPPFASLLASHRSVEGVPLIVELRDLWAENEAFDRGGPVLRKLESRVVRGAAAVVAVTPEAAEDLQRRHPGARVEEIPNGFEPALIAMRKVTTGTTTAPPLGMLDRELPAARRLLGLVQRPPRPCSATPGYVAPEIEREIAASSAEVEVVPPSSWEAAVRRIADADVALVTQARGAGDATAVAAKVYEYLALGKPVLALTDGGATRRRFSASWMPTSSPRGSTTRLRSKPHSSESARETCRRRSRPRSSLPTSVRA